MNSIPVGDTQLSSIVLGQGKVPIVMLHGLIFGNLATWYSSIALPLSGTRRVVLYDQRGHGLSPVTKTGYDLDTQITDLQAVLGYYGADSEPLDIVGHSMGALIALYYALKHPGRVRRLVLVNPPYPVSDYVVPELQAAASTDFLAAYIDERVGLRSGRRSDRAFKRLSSLLFDTSLISDLQATQSIDNADFESLSSPVLIVVGERSACADAGRRLHGRIPGSQFVTMNSGHYIPEESPSYLYRLIADFCGVC